MYFHLHFLMLSSLHHLSLLLLQSFCCCVTTQPVLCHKHKENSHLPDLPKTCLVLGLVSLFLPFFSFPPSFNFTANNFTILSFASFHQTILLHVTICFFSFFFFLVLHFFSFRFLRTRHLSTGSLKVLGSLPWLSALGVLRSPPWLFSSKVLGSLPWLFFFSFPLQKPLSSHFHGTWPTRRWPQTRRVSVEDVRDTEAEHAKHGRARAQAGHQSKKTTWTQNQSSCSPTSHIFTRSVRKERTVVLVSPADHAQHVKEGAIRENVTQGVIDSPQQQTRRAKPTAGEKSKANSRREEQSQEQTKRTKGLRTRQG